MRRPLRALLAPRDQHGDSGDQRDPAEDRRHRHLLALSHRRGHAAEADAVLAARVGEATVRESDDTADDEDDSESAHAVHLGEGFRVGSGDSYDAAAAPAAAAATAAWRF